MASMKIIQFLHRRPKFFHSLDLGRPLSNEPPPPASPSPSRNDNQSIKENIIQG